MLPGQMSGALLRHYRDREGVSLIIDLAPFLLGVLLPVSIPHFQASERLSAL